MTKRLENLEAVGFISSYVPFEHRKRGIYYRISDEYCYFYLTWITPIKHQLKQMQAKRYWKTLIDSPKYHGWLGYAFENICYKHISQIKLALKLDESSLASPWRYVPRANSREQGVQIDLLFDRSDGAINLCEIKYSSHQFTIDKEYSIKLQRKISVFKEVTNTQKQIFFSFIASSGLKKNTYSNELIRGVVTADDLFRKDD